MSQQNIKKNHHLLLFFYKYFIGMRLHHVPVSDKYHTGIILDTSKRYIPAHFLSVNTSRIHP